MMDQATRDLAASNLRVRTEQMRKAQEIRKQAEEAADEAVAAWAAARERYYLACGL